MPSSDPLDELPEVGERRIAVRITDDALRRVRAGHPWIFDRSIRSVGHDGAPGDLSPHQALVLDGIELVGELIDVADGIDVLCVFTEWPEFAKIDLEEVVAGAGVGTTIVDMRNLFDPCEVRAVGLGYDGVGRR